MLLNGTSFLIQVISGGGIPVAEQVKVTGSASFTVYVKVLSTGKVMFGMTAENDTSKMYLPVQTQSHIRFLTWLTMNYKSGLLCSIPRFIHSHTAIGTSIRELCANDG